jgi:hypothetical protein
MNDHPVSPLPPDVIDALERERAPLAVDLATRSRLRERLHANLLAGGSGGHGAGRPEHAFPEEVPSAQISPEGAVSEGASAAGIDVWSVARRAHPLLTAVVGFAIGLGTGVAIATSRAGREPEPRGASHTLSVASTAVSRERAPSEVVVSAAPGGSEVPPQTARVQPSASASASTLTAERALLDIAHAALSNGRAADSLAALSQHAQRFPHGVYREEREALTIRCLRALGRTDEAERRSSAFKMRYPRSLFLPTNENENGTNR